MVNIRVMTPAAKWTGGNQFLQCALPFLPLQYQQYHYRRHIYLVVLTSAGYLGPTSSEVFVKKTVKEVITCTTHYVLAICSAYKPVVLRIR